MAFCLKYSNKQGFKYFSTKMQRYHRYLPILYTKMCYTMRVGTFYGGVLDSLGEAVARVARRDSTWSR